MRKRKHEVDVLVEVKRNEDKGMVYQCEVCAIMYARKSNYDKHMREDKCTEVVKEKKKAHDEQNVNLIVIDSNKDMKDSRDERIRNLTFVYVSLTLYSSRDFVGINFDKQGDGEDRQLVAVHWNSLTTGIY